MVKKMKEISPGRYRESFGRYYEEFVVGDVYEHRPGRTITQSDNIWFTLLTMNQHPLHIDDEYGKGTEFGKTLVVSPFTVALMVGMSVSDVSQKTVANLGWTDIKMTHPIVFHGIKYCMQQWFQLIDSGQCQKMLVKSISVCPLFHRYL